MSCRYCEEPKPKKKVVAKTKAPATKKKVVKKK